MARQSNPTSLLHEPPGNGCRSGMTHIRAGEPGPASPERALREQIDGVVIPWYRSRRGGPSQNRAGLSAGDLCAIADRQQKQIDRRESLSFEPRVRPLWLRRALAPAKPVLNDLL